MGEYRCACAFEALETTIEAFKMIFCALKRSRIILYDDEKGESYGESSDSVTAGNNTFQILKEKQAIFLIF